MPAHRRRAQVNPLRRQRHLEIDGKPVLEVLREYLVGEEIDNWSKAVSHLCFGLGRCAAHERLR
jgi:hypothetical protein